MQIEPLADHPEFIQILAVWHQAEWGYLHPNCPLEDRIARLSRAVSRQGPPVTFVASENGQLIGSAMLLEHDMDTRMDLSPWLAGVFTAPEFRGNGIATQLCCHVVRHAADLGFRRLYLYTPDAETFYARLGWEVIDRTGYRNTNVTVMSHDEMN